MYKVKNKENSLLHGELTYQIIGLVYEVNKQYGNGQKELVYQNALSEKFDNEKMMYKREVGISIKSEDTGKVLGNYRLDFVIDSKVVIETKAMKFTPVKIQNQLYSYLKQTPYEVGLLVNFGSTRLYIKRVILTNNEK